MKNSILIYPLFAILIACNSTPTTSSQDETKSNDTTEKVQADPFLKDGEEKTKYPNGVIKTLGSYIKGKRDGQWYSWHSTGKPWSETFFENGVKNGPTKSWHDNGNLRYEGIYLNDSKTGVWKYFDENGKLMKEVDYTEKK